MTVIASDDAEMREEIDRFFWLRDVTDSWEVTEVIERRELEQAAKLRALQTATEAGIAALESGAFKDFANAAELENYLVAVSNDALAGNVHPR